MTLLGSSTKATLMNSRHHCTCKPGSVVQVRNVTSSEGMCKLHVVSQELNSKGRLVAWLAGWNWMRGITLTCFVAAAGEFPCDFQLDEAFRNQEPPL